ncbi:transposase [Pediococcus acidilactici]|nr:transposase [Pediococcus acidilactici]
MPHEQLDFEEFHKWTYFPYWITAKDIVDRLLNLDPALKQTYDVLNKLQAALKHKDWNNYNAAFWNTEGCSEEMLSTLKMLQTHHDEIHNTFITQHSNGPLEGLNNKIKAIKRAGFGYRNFF